MTFQLDDPIAALASPPGGAARGIIRISGPGVAAVVESRFHPDNGQPWTSVRAARRATGTLSLRSCRVPLPTALYYWPTSRSYTGQPSIELHTAGSPPLLEAVLADLHAAGIRSARPGEFTLRAFLAGRLDLMQAEAVLGVIDAADHRELEVALRQLAGGLSGRIADCRAGLLDLLAELEAGLDFVEEDIRFISQDELAHRLGNALDLIQTLLAQSAGRFQSRTRLRIVLAGLPNAGKSTLFNALAQREAALVSEIRGTTRDYLCAELDWSGTPIELIDTAGWENETAAIAGQAQQLRHEQVAQADLILWCRAADLDDEARSLDAKLAGQLADGPPLIAVETKSDLRQATDDDAAGDPPHVSVSVPRGAGLAELRERALATLAAARGGRQFVGSTAARCRESLEQAAAALSRARSAATASAGDEIVAIDVRDALDHLGRIVGAIYTDDILDRIFSKFCIGK